MLIAQNLNSVLHNIDSAVSRRSTGCVTGNTVKLVAVTKNHTTISITEALELGVSSIGENRIQEAASKKAILPSTIEWHLIGHLQSNKVKQAVPMFDLIHSVDSERLAVEINTVAQKMDKVQNILIQVNISGEKTKFGISPDKLFELARFTAGLKHIRLCGLMTMAPHYQDAEAARPLFRDMYNLYQQLYDLKLANTDIRWLSMGMTNDYVVAIEEGANLVRIGTAIFGEREY